ncbi:DP-EP family protein [Pseudoalteromonas sp. 68 DY56-GL68]|uniref:DP-EP family protein n=1 Tax=Pseudoalteromonas sp. 68 DY56-GL68 TaxID=2974919 RepID=UPI00352A6111
MSENKTYNFTVNIALNSNNEAIFTYFQNGQEVSGGGTVKERNSLGIYTLNEATAAKGFKFTGAKFTNLEGNCAQDFTPTVIDNGLAIHITDSDENKGIVCMVFTVHYNGNNYESADPQIINKEED